MKPQIRFSFAESLALERILTFQTERAKHTITLSYLMDKWSLFVTKVEGEYRLTIDDYTNSLSVRNVLQDILNACPANVDLKEWVIEWDSRFARVTRITKEPLLHPLDNEKLDWWWFRVPVHPGTKLKEWLQDKLE